MPIDPTTSDGPSPGELHTAMSSSSLPWSLLRVLALLASDGRLPLEPTFLDISRLTEQEILGLPGIGTNYVRLIRGEVKRRGGSLAEAPTLGQDRPAQ